MSSTLMERPKLLEFYEQRVLPALFERLDEAFPEIEWTRGRAGWSGIRRATRSGRPVSQPTRVACRQPWGFEEQEAGTSSWLTYANGGRKPHGEELVHAVRKLATLAGVDDAMLDRPFSPSERAEADRQQRQRELLEAFTAYCRTALESRHGDAALEYLHRAFGIDGRQASHLPLGVYTSQDDVHDFLHGVGFTEEEIAAARVARDHRLPGRIIVPWRDRWGRLKSIVALRPAGDPHEQGGQLHWHREGEHNWFGLDLALREEAGGREHLVVVEHVLDAVYFQLHGFHNVAAMGRGEKTPSPRQWEWLAEQGVRSVTLVMADSPTGHVQMLSAIDAADQAGQAPDIFCLPHGSLGEANHLATFGRLHGMGRVRRLLEGRLHAYHFVAEHIICKHQRDDGWTDANLLAALHEAVDYDGRTYRPSRASELERFFWPPILAATQADWDTVRLLLARRIDAVLKTRSGAWNVDRCRRLVDELRFCLESHDLERFGLLIRAAAHGLGNYGPDASVAVERIEGQMHGRTNGRARKVRRKRTVVRERQVEPLPPAPPAPVVKEPPKPEPPKAEPMKVVHVATPHPGAQVVRERVVVREPAPAAKAEQFPLDIQRIAYLLWEEDGRPIGEDQRFWYEAERAVKALRRAS